MVPTPSPGDPDGPASGPRLRVVVAMSGGVDSSVVAALMHQAGHEVIGITLQLYDHGAATGRKGSCCAGQDIHDARRVADALSIPHYVLDYESRFAASVIDSFAESYAAGETPIPCVTCNQQIKFRDLLDTAKELGADVLATGHYIQRREGPRGPELMRAADPDRDQSYFLFATTPEQLRYLWFPLGGMPKAEVRELARQLGLPVAEKADSQDICFVPTGRYTGVIERLKPGAVKPGDIVHVDGRRLGRHEGIINYTVGQRKGLGIPGPEPLYVVRLDAEHNEVVVGPRDCLRTKSLVLRNTNWLGDEPFAQAAGGGLRIFARIRSSQAPQAATVFAEADGVATVVLEDGEDGVAVGQACVFYASGAHNARLLGGGFIARTIAQLPGTPKAAELFRADTEANLRGVGPEAREIDVAN
ncbi:MAG: tRNA 2-thiouridine(34) synthase MnmA [Hyphomicrobium sp.]